MYALDANTVIHLFKGWEASRSVSWESHEFGRVRGLVVEDWFSGVRRAGTR